MNDRLMLLLMFLSGALLGAIYLAGLWLTVKRLQRGRHPALWLLASITIRLLLLVIVFYLILGDGHWQRLLAALAGFVTMRVFTARKVSRPGLKAGNDRQEQT